MCERTLEDIMGLIVVKVEDYIIFTMFARKH